jgi:DNA-binding response OmpR family regulator
VTVADKPIALTALEYRAIRYLVHNRGRPVSRVELAEQVYGGEREPDSNALEVLIGRLRKKLGQDFISTRRGYGYVIAD